jgi:hypothetical protein
MSLSLGVAEEKGSRRMPGEAASGAEQHPQMDLSRADSVFISKEEYIPYVFAEEKVKQISSDMTRMRDKYEKHIVVMADRSNAKVAELKAYYDTYIKDLKKKALQHLDIQHTLFEDREQLSRLSAKTLEDRIEELIDLNAKNRLEFQEKAKQVERDSSQTMDEKITCDTVLREICDELERREASVAGSKQDALLKKEADSFKNHEMQSAMIRQGVQDSLLTVLHQLDMDFLHAQQQQSDEKVMAAVIKSSENEDSLKNQFEELKEKNSKAQEERDEQNAKAQEERERLRDEASESRVQELQQLKEVELLAKDSVIDEMKLEMSTLKGTIVDLRSEISKHQVALCLEKVLCDVELKDSDDVKARLHDSSVFTAKLMSEQSADGSKLAELQAEQVESQKKYAELLADRDAERQKAENALKQLEEARANGGGGGPDYQVGPRTIGAMPSAVDPVPLHLRLKLQALKDKMEEDTKKEIVLSKEKSESKHELKAWLHDFEEKNGRPAENDEKDEIKDKFEHQRNLSAELKDLQTSMDVTLSETEQLQQRISDLEAKRADPSARRVSVANKAAVSENNQTREQPVAAADGEAAEQGEGYSEEELAAIRHEWELEKEADLQALTAQVATVTLARDQLQILLDNVKNETRTDVIKRLEGELQVKQAALTLLSEASMTAKAAQVKMQTKVAETTERAERAEEELVERDERYQKNLSESEEKRMLAEQIAKQREDIIMKSKAATSGWDAAAHAEEMLDIEVDRAYQNGLKEGRQVVEGDVAMLHTSIEEKDKRNIDLLEQIGVLESSVKEAELRVDQAEKASSLAVRQARASGGGGGGGGEANEETLEELRQAREELDNAQEECIATAEQLSSAQQEIAVCREQLQVYQDLLAQLAAGGGGVTVAPTAAAHSSAKGTAAVAAVPVSKDAEERAKAKLAEIEASIRHAVVEGSKLWKEGKREPCFDLYAAVNTKLQGLLKTRALLGPLETTRSDAADLPRNKGAVLLRKSFDRLLEDLSDDSATYAAEVFAQAGGTVGVPASPAPAAASAGAGAPVVFSGGGANADAVQQLQAKLAALEKKRSTLESNSATESHGQSGISAALLKRAKEAEEKVADLRQQLGDAKAASRPAGKRGAAGGGGADPAEIRKLQRKIKDLEASGGGGGGGGGGDKKALAQQEKTFQKKMKDLDLTNRKEKTALETRAKGAEKELADTKEQLHATTQERDQLRQKVKELTNMSAEMEALRARAAQADEFSGIIGENKLEIARLTEQYKKEGQMRKKYKNELEDLKGAIRVYARMRPMAQYEKDRECKQIVQFTDETAMKIQTSRGEKEFEFDAAFTDNSTQDEVFEDTKRLVESFLDGFNVCLFAYGQTGSGKTFTMTGSPSMPGLTPKAISEMFRLIDERKHCNCRVTTYFVELYNDNLVDLYWVLDNKKHRSSAGDPPKLDIKVDAKKMVYIKNCVMKEASSPAELMDLFNKGNKERHTGATQMNAESSRSHSIFAIMVECFDTTTKKTTMGKLSLVDLAGSERADKTGAGAERLKEAQNINKSLSALGDVISALSEGEKFIPYRNNKLTQLMQDSLGGNAKTLMFVNFSPADYNADETVTSLNYAARVKKIVNNASKQAESEEVARLKSIIKKLQAGQILEVEPDTPAASHEPDAAALAALEKDRERRAAEDGVAFGADGSETKS